ncbi:MAG: phenylacetyl CoA [Gammaproteobacteria bacterium]|nr:MAG: phenylacetyl CoA [Gammaproteobacteria bacterium]
MSVGGKPWLQTHWDWHVALNFLTGGSGSGLLLVAVLGALAGQSLAAPTWVGLLLVAGGLAQVSLHLGRPLRGLNVLLNPHTSWMTREAIVAGPLLALAGLAALLDSTVIGLLVGLLAAAFLYCQARILKEARGIPAWREPRIVPLVITTGLAEGLALYLLIAVAAGRNEALLPVGVALLAALVVRFTAWRRYRQALQGHAPLAALAVLDRAEGPFAGAGHVAPVLLLLVAVWVPSAQGPLVTMAALAALLAGWGVKFAIVTRASYNQGFAITHTPARGAGTGGIGDQPGW